jgi:hypothetical protein
LVFLLLIHSGDHCKLAGFFEDGTFQVGQIDNLTIGQHVGLRAETGRPLWTGRGERSA